MKVYNCATCGVETPNHWRRKTARFCSQPCAGAALRKPSLDQSILPVSRFSWIRVPIHGGSMVIDLANWPLYISRDWHINDAGYAVNRGMYVDKDDMPVKATVRFHRLVARTPEGMATDHINHDRLDNRDRNLRVCTQQSNNANRLGARGYCWDSSKGKWMVRYRHTFYGRYDTEEEARLAYQLAKSGVPYKKQRERRKLYYLPVGVTKFGKKYIARGYKWYGGSFSTIAEAERAYKEAKKERIGS